MALANTPTASPMIEADPNYGSTFEEEDDYRSRRKYWYQLRPGDHLIPLLALTPHHPLLTGGPIEPQTPSNSFSSYDSTNVDGSSSTISSPTSQGSQPGSPFTSSSQPAGLPKNTVAVPPPALEPPPDRQRCGKSFSRHRPQPSSCAYVPACMPRRLTRAQRCGPFHTDQPTAGSRRAGASKSTASHPTNTGRPISTPSPRDITWCTRRLLPPPQPPPPQ